ncbi:glycosyltransferase family 2 protein [Cognatilysobacter lacus]|uniref:Glycosyltransferase family 2 protein n=1 Tax=Cognatilysobacter lacus TaxID=1643323 RepID=A0A5D8Z8G9_9GAMM|nr:glycosyltransferase family 2 protein [Lysobacter lacus]TZF91225.1 glycosyltransferase family 2 protein [Lysobacter lacus]
MTELTILMPCLNEAETLATCVRKARRFLESSGIDGEILIGDNGSTDGSQAIARTEGATVVDISRRGYGAALIGGIEAAKGRYIIMGDADDSYDFSSLDTFVDRLRAGADLVMGNRFRGGIGERAMPFLHRYLGNPVLSWLGRLFYGIPIGDFHCGLRGFNRDRMRALNLTTPGMEFASEMVVKAAIAGYRVEEVPTTLQKDGRSRPPHLRTWRDGWRHLRFLLIFSPRFLYLIPGATLVTAGLLGVAATYGGPAVLARGVVLDVHAYVGFVFMAMLGAQFLTFGVMMRRVAGMYGIRSGEGLIQRSIRLFATLEWSLAVSAIGLLAGSVGAVRCFLAWQGTDFAPMAYGALLKPFILSLAVVVVSVQLLAAAFFAASMEEYTAHRALT